MKKWYRALDEVQQSESSWMKVNEMFRSYTCIMDESFSTGIKDNSPVYVPVTTGKEEAAFCKCLFSPDAQGKLYLLEGPIGSGKSTLVKYLCQVVLDIVFSEDYSFSVILDVQKTHLTQQEIISNLTESLRDSIINKMFSYDGGELDLYDRILQKSIGRENVKKISPIERLSHGKKLSLKDFCNFFNNLSKEFFSNRKICL